MQLQLLTGTRPQEVMALKPSEVLDRGDGTWLYTPAAHKTEHLGREKVIVIGPRAQEVLRPWLDRDPGAYCFSPAEAVAWSRDGRRVASAGSDRSLRLWSAGAEKELKSLKGSSEWLYSVEFDRDGRRVAAGAWDGTLRIWDVESGRELGVLIALPAAGDGEADWALVSSRGWFRASAKVLCHFTSPGSTVGLAGVAGAVFATAAFVGSSITRLVGGGLSSA